ncbi:hypothetical protein [Candidatus Lucifugimonas marina]|uniref:Uncharacterized protein n=1 Tax=Candidatus Lucifugimonas marina TaxID=3038979 RepID=A0AAJ5ZJI3_9CHLR|nr:hypothetical protein [SAR202 cluster bacterium JH702]MDG0868693.1 hypothetical protein [SAR202 cluster bacterium JH639]WFG35325.1 hypothetical protein GKN94_06345 [SAR202 cluster bacterium JH545]WFG39273.1 hypothetical protein GKO48_06465 [SAR202 cluster bacterium JH1073]
MRVILVGCEYVGTTTLAHAIDDWLETNMGVRFSLIHDHWKIPHTSGHPDDTTPEEQEWLLAASPKFKEMHQRHSLYYHAQVGTFEGHDDGMVIGGAIEDGVYGPMFFGYGGPDHRLNRETVQHQWEKTILHFTDETVLVHVTAETDVIAQRLRDDPHENMVICESDIDRVKKRFAELVEWSVLDKKIHVDNSGAIEDTMAQFVEKIEPYLTDIDRSRMKANG